VVVSGVVSSPSLNLLVKETNTRSSRVEKEHEY